MRRMLKKGPAYEKRGRPPLGPSPVPVNCFFFVNPERQHPKKMLIPGAGDMPLFTVCKYAKKEERKLSLALSYVI